MLKLSNENISRLYLGNIEIVKAYMGNDLVFSKTKTYTVTASIDPAGSGTVTGAGQYEEGAQVTLTATPGEGYNFKGWKATGASRLPAGYTELQYIESSGTQYIDTGVIPSETLRVDTDIYVPKLNTSTVAYSGVFSKVENTIVQFRNYISDAQVVYFVYGASFFKMQNSLTVGRHTFSLDAYNNQAHYDDETVELSAPSALPSSNIILFASDSNGTIANQAAIRLYSCQMYEEGILIRDFVPCKNASGVVGLYDLMNGVFYTNQGTGNFTAGSAGFVSESAEYTFTVTGDRELVAVFEEIPQSRLPAGYTELQYIESSGAQYIDTGIAPDATTKVVMDAQTLSTNTTSYAKYFFSSGYYSSYSYEFGIFWYKTGIKAEMGRGTSSIPNITLSSSTSPARVLLELNAVNKTASLNGVATAMTSNVLSTSMGTLKLLSGNTTTTTATRLPARVYSCQIYKNSAPVRDFVPCTNPTGTVGLYDLTNNKFYAPAAGTLTAGPAV